MIVIDSDVAIDILRGRPTAVGWFDTLSEDEVLVVPGYVAMELIWGTKDSKDLRATQQWLAACKVVWLEPEMCDRAFQLLASVHLRNALGVFDALIAQVALSLDLPLHTFNQKHFSVVNGLQTVRPYTR